MIKGLKLNAKSFAKTGAIQTQPIPKVILKPATATVQQNVAGSTTTSDGSQISQLATTLPPVPQITGISTLSGQGSGFGSGLGSSGQATVNAATNINKVATSTNPITGFPEGLNANFKPKTGKQKKQENVAIDENIGINKHQPPIETKQTVSSGLLKDATPLEELTSVSEIRPEILMLSKFNPLYVNENQKTEQGELFDVFVESLRQIDAKTSAFLSGLNEETINQKSENLKKEISYVRNNLNNLSSIIKFINTAKTTHLDLFRQNYEFSPTLFVNKNFSSGTRVTKDSLIPFAKKLDQKLSLEKSLEIVYDQKNVAKNFSGTKLWMVAINELKELVRSHSLPILNIKLENSNTISPLGQSINFYPSLSSDKRLSITDFISDPNPNPQLKRFEILALQTHGLDDDKLIALSFYLSIKELSHRTCLTLKKIDQTPDSRSQLLNSLFGIYPTGQIVFDRNQSYSGTKLSDISYFRDVNNSSKTVLTFEKTDVPYNTLIGEDYFFGNEDSENTLINFLNVNKLDDFKTVLENLDKTFFNFMANIALFPCAENENVGNVLLEINPSLDLNSFNIDLLSYDPSTFFKKVINQFIDESGNFIAGTKIKQKNSKVFDENDLIAIMARSGADDPVGFKLRDSLYNYIYSISLASDQEVIKQSTDSIVSSLISLLKTNIPTFVQGGMTPGDIELRECNLAGNLFQTQTSIYNVVTSSRKSGILKKLSDILAIFKLNNLGFLCPLIFNSLCKLISTVSNVKIVSLEYIHQVTHFKLFTCFKNPELVTSTNLAKKKNISSIIDQEINRYLSLSFSVLNSIDVLRSNFQSSINQIKQFDSNILQIFLRYLNNDTKKLNLLLREPQLIIALSYVEDLYKSFQKPPTQNQTSSNLFIKNYEGLSYSTKVVNALNEFFKFSEFRQDEGYNKQIISVGIPQGLLKKLFYKSRLASKNINASKHNDIFKVLVYKVDLLNDDIVYFPKSFLFEASRFPVRVNSLIKDIQPGILDTIYNSFPTRNYSLFSDPNLVKVGQNEQWGDESNSFGDEYVFLSQNQKNEILKNHIQSFLLENYLQIMSGLKVNDSSFTVSSAEEIEQLNKSLINSDVVLQVENNNPIFAGLSQSFISGLFPKNIFDISIALSLPNSSAYVSKFLQPKKFDRIYNIIFDPEFQVDYVATKGAKLGIDTDIKLEKLVTQGILKKPINNQNVYFDSNKSFQDPSLNSYFVVIESFDEPSNPLLATQEVSIQGAIQQLAQNPNLLGSLKL